MKMNLMRTLDTWVGKPIAFALGLPRRSSPCLGGNLIQEKSQQVLVVKILGMGSCILALPLLEELRKQKHKIGYLTLKSNAQLIEKAKLSHNIYYIDNKNIWTLMSSTLRALRQIRQQKYNVIFDLEPTSYLTAILSQFFAAQFRVGFNAGKPTREKLYTHLIAYSSQTHFANLCLKFASLLQIKTQQEVLLPSSPMSRSNYAQGFKFVFNMTSSDLAPQRLWRAQSWVLLAKEILKNSQAEIYFTGLKEDQKDIEDLIREIGHNRAFNFAGKTNLDQLITLLLQSRMIVTVDSGIMHLAAWLDIPQVALFGPESPVAFGPLGDKAKVLYTQRSCSPCLTVQTNKQSRCQDNQCLKEISAEQVLWACRHHIEKHYAPKPNKKAA